MELTKLSIPQLEDFLIKWVGEVEKKGMKWAETKALYETIDDKRKPTLAHLMGNYDGSNAAQEKGALSDPGYLVFLEGLSAARKDFYQSQVDYDTAKLKIDCLRTIISARKEEIKKFSG